MSKTMTSETTTRTIGECFPYIKNGANIKQDKEGDGFPVTRIETISGGGFHRDRMGYANIHDAEKYKNWVLHDGDILMSHINSIPNLGRAVEYKAEEGETIIHGMNLLALRADRTIVIPGYADIYFSSTVFRNYVFRITKKAVNQASFSIKDLKTVPIPLPSLETQKAIAQQFAQINTLHQELLQKIDCLDAVIKSRFIEMFHEVKQICTLETLIAPETRISYGIVQPGPEGTGDMGVLRPVDIADGRLCLEEVKRIDRAIGESYRRTELTGDEILTIVRGATGQTVRSKVDCAGMNVTRGIAVIRYEPSLINPDYLVGYMNSDDGKRYITDHTQGATLQQINIADLRVMPIPVPPLALQQEFAAFVAQVDKLRFAAQQQIDKLQMLKKSLLQEYFN